MNPIYVIEIGGRQFRLNDREFTKAMFNNLGIRPLNVVDIVMQ